MGFKKSHASSVPKTLSPKPWPLAPSLEILAEELEVGNRECMWVLEKHLR